MAAMLTEEKTKKSEPTENGIYTYYLKGECTFGSKCVGEHSPELSPELKPHDDHKEFEVPGVRSEACMRCLDNSVPVCSFWEA